MHDVRLPRVDCFMVRRSYRVMVCCRRSHSFIKTPTTFTQYRYLSEMCARTSAVFTGISPGFCANSTDTAYAATVLPWTILQYVVLDTLTCSPGDGCWCSPVIREPLDQIVYLLLRQNQASHPKSRLQGGQSNVLGSAL